MKRLALLLIVPLILVGPGLLPGQRFLPWLPVQLSPLSTEFPEAAAAAEPGTNQNTFDRLFPALSDQLAFEDVERTGQLGAWESRLGLGIPLLGNSLSAPFYPPNLLARAISPDRAAGPLALLTLLLAGLGTWCFLARLGLSTPACLAASLGVQAAGFGVTNLYYPMKVDAVVWLPFAWFAIEGIVRLSGRSRTRSTGLLAISIGAPLLAGFPPIALFAATAAGVYALIAAGPARRALGLAGSVQRGSWPRLILGAGLGVALSLVQLVPTLRASFESYRPPKEASELEALALPSSTLIALPLPDVYGAPADPRPTWGPAFAWWTTGAEHSGRTQTAQSLEWNTYPGLGALLLAVVAVVAGGRSALPPALIVLLFLGFAQGWPLLRLAYHLPPLAGGEPSRALSVAWLAWGWLGAVGFDALARRKRRARTTAWIVGLIALVGGGWLAFGPLDEPSWTEAVAREHDRPLEEVRVVLDELAVSQALGQLRRAGRLQLLFGAGLIGLAALAGPGRRRLCFGALGALLAISEAALFSSEHTQPSALGDQPLLPRSDAIEALREAVGDGRVVRLDESGGTAELERLARPNLLQMYGLNDLTGYIAFPPRGWVDLTERVDRASRRGSGFAALTSADVLDAPLLDLLRVSAVLSLREIDHPRLEVVHRGPEFVVHRRSGALPPARLVQSERIFQDREELLEALSNPEVDFPSVVHTLRSPEQRFASKEPATRSVPPVQPTVERLRADVIRVALPANSTGLLVVHDQFARGWRAESSGLALEVFESDGAYLTVEIPPGAREVEFRYAPREDLLAVAISLLAAGISLGLLASFRARGADSRINAPVEAPIEAPAA